MKRKVSKVSLRSNTTITKHWGTEMKEGTTPTILDQHYPTQVHLDLATVILVSLDPTATRRVEKRNILCSTLSFLLPERADGLKRAFSPMILQVQRRVNICFLSLSHCPTVVLHLCWRKMSQYLLEEEERSALLLSLSKGRTRIYIILSPLL